MMIGDESKKDEDILLYVSQRLKEIAKKYKSKLSSFEMGDENLKALAVYIACYYHERN